MNHPKLFIYVDNEELRAYYQTRITEHNTHVTTDPFPNSGFDLAVPETIAINDYNSTKVDLQVKCKMDDNDVCIGYYTYPRSSLSKTPLVVGNHVGIIDCGYRGNLIAMFRNLSPQPYVVEKQTRLMQICHPSLKPFTVHMVKHEEDLGSTSRGSGGFGSTGNK
jgi:dUTP pyrophosphatase